MSRSIEEEALKGKPMNVVNWQRQLSPYFFNQLHRSPWAGVKWLKTPMIVGIILCTWNGGVNAAEVPATPEVIPTHEVPINPEMPVPIPATAAPTAAPTTTPPPTSDLPNLPTTFPTAPPKDEAATENPLELREPDPLLPTLAIDRPLSPQEQSVLNAALDELDREAQAKFAAGDIAGAVDIWNRELRLRRYLGSEQEVASLSRVGEVAWRENQVTEVRVITQRLQQIQQQEEAKTPINYDLLMKIAQAYQSMRARDQAVVLYNQLLVQAQQEQKVNRQRMILTALGEMHVAWFDYPNAAAAYEQLLALTQGNTEREIEALTQLSEVYQQGNQPEKAIAVQQRLVDIYQNQKNYEPISALKQAMGDEYAAIGRPDLAATSYQEAYAVARSTQQYAYGGDALQRLANLYVNLNRFQDALVVYQLVLDVKQQSYDTLGLMNTYDQIGQLHRVMGNNAQAATAFRQGLQLAQQLNYKADYFTSQIQALEAPATPPAAPPATAPTPPPVPQ